MGEKGIIPSDVWESLEGGDEKPIIIRPGKKSDEKHRIDSAEGTQKPANTPEETKDEKGKE